MVDRVIPFEQQLGHRHDVVAVRQELFDDAGQGLRRVLGGVVEQDDGAWGDFAEYAVGDLRRGEVFPVQTVGANSKWHFKKAIQWYLAHLYP